MIIGILKEEGSENRVALLPQSVATLTKMLVTVLVEKDAGIKAFASDSDYETAGAKIASKADVIAQSEMLIKINPPSDGELSLMKEKAVFLAVLNPFFRLEPNCCYNTTIKVSNHNNNWFDFGFETTSNSFS